MIAGQMLTETWRVFRFCNGGFILHHPRSDEVALALDALGGRRWDTSKCTAMTARQAHAVVDAMYDAMPALKEIYHGMISDSVKEQRAKEVEARQ